MTAGTYDAGTVDSDSPYAHTSCSPDAGCFVADQECRNGCGIPIGYMPDHRHGQRYVMGGYWHADGKSLCRSEPDAMPHCAAPIPSCPKCSSREGIGTVQTMWGIQTDCTACGYSSYFSIGD